MCVHLRFAQCAHAAYTSCGYYLGWCSFFSVHPIVRLLFERSVYSGSYYYPDTGTLTFSHLKLSVIGASLSEPHTSVTALRTHVSIYLSIYLSDYGLTTCRKF